MSDVTGAGTAVSGVAQAAGTVTAASIQADATKEAAKLATDSANRSADLVQQRYATTRGDLLPYQGEGQLSLYAIQDRLPIYADSGTEYSDLMRGSLPGQTLDDVQAPPRLTQAELEATPGYQFALSQGQKAVQSSAAARGLGVSGAALKGASTFATGLADNTYQNQFAQLQSQFQDKLNLQQGKFNQGQQQFADWQNVGTFDQTNRTNSLNRLLSVGGMGENAAAMTGNAGSQAANAAGNFLTAGASGAAAGLIQGANAWGGAINSLGNQLGQASQLNRLLGNNGQNGGSMYDTSGSGASYNSTQYSAADRAAINDPYNY